MIKLKKDEKQMSASTEKKNRAAELAAGPTRKQLAAEKEAAAKAKSKRIRAAVAVVVAVVIVLVLLFNTGVLYNTATAVTIGNQNYTPAVVEYYTASQYYNFINQYGSYASIFGLDTSSGLAGAAVQTCPMVEDGTWKDYFMEAGVSQLTQVKALLDYAKANNITLDEDDNAYVEANMDALHQAAESQNMSVKSFLKAYYGGSLSEKLVRECVANDALADKAYGVLAESYEYSDAELEEYYSSLNGASDVFTYAYYTVTAEKVESTDADGNTTSAVTDETMAAAKSTADAIVKAYKSAPAAAAEAADSEALKLKAEADAYNTVSDKFSAAVASVAGADATKNQTNGSSLNAAYSEWMMGNVKSGDVTVVETADGTGYIVVLFLDRNDNHYHTAMVRHILVNAEADENGNYTDAALEEAYSTAAQYLKEWESGEKTEESFAIMANLKSEDGGSNTNGGLYDGVTMGQTVPAFDAFCFGNHKAGDTAIVYGTNGQYAGYHVMYYVGESEELHSNEIAKTDLVNDATAEWMQAAIEALNPQTKFFAKLA